ncbi:MAG: hypothetical protein QOJ69_1511 [Actinomycetota bacterium]|nr:hypothetical protein [Actinomycetota bacterium]
MNERRLDARTPDSRTSVVIATFNRRDELLHTLDELESLPEKPPVVVVDNASTDGTSDVVRALHPGVTVVRLDRPRGSSARNLGVARVSTPYVAFADDDSWWAPGALAAAADLFDRHPRLGLVAAKVLVGPERRLDPASAEMAESPILPAGDVPGLPVIGFQACAAVVRKEAFEQAGGFNPRAGFGGEETLLAVDLLDVGWRLVYVDELVAFRHGSETRDSGRRRTVDLHNELLRTWLRLPAAHALRWTRQVLAGAEPGQRLRLLPDVVRSLSTIVRGRRVAASSVLRQLALVGMAPTVPPWSSRRRGRAVVGADERHRVTRLQPPGTLTVSVSVGKLEPAAGQVGNGHGRGAQRPLDRADHAAVADDQHDVAVPV